jgi:intracellular septation protein
MQALVDFLPLVVFFVVYLLYGIYAATAALIVSMAVQITYQWVRHRQVSKMLLISGIAVAVLGGITLWLRNPLFIKWKPTVVYWLFAAAFFASQFFGEKTLTERVMGQALQLDAALWRQLNLMWAVVFLVLGAVNVYVLYNYSEQTWAFFKVFGVTALLFLVALAQGGWILLKSPKEEPERTREP